MHNYIRLENPHIYSAVIYDPSQQQHSAAFRPFRRRAGLNPQLIYTEASPPSASLCVSLHILD